MDELLNCSRMHLCCWYDRLAVTDRQDELAGQGFDAGYLWSLQRRRHFSSSRIRAGRHDTLHM